MSIQRAMTQKMPPQSTADPQADLDDWIRSIEQRERWLSEHFQALSQYLLVEQEEERRKLSRILHDRIGQSLTAAIINLQTAQMTGGKLDEDMLVQTCQTLSDCLTEVREMSLNLRPSQLDELGLKLAVEAYLQRVLTSEHQQYTLSAEDLTERLEADVETTAFRIIQDVIALCRRQDKPFYLGIRLNPKRRQLHVDLSFSFAEDSDCASDIDDKQFLGVRERTAMLGGECSIEQKDHHWHIHSHLPYSKAA